MMWFFATFCHGIRYMALFRLSRPELDISSGSRCHPGMNIVFEVADLGHGLVFQNLAYYG